MSGPAGIGADPPAGRRFGYTSLGATGLLAAALGYIDVVDPHKPGSFLPICPFRLLTGWNCPACGGLRMVHDVLHGHLTAAINDNIVLLIGIPMLAGWAFLRRHRRQWPLTLPAAVAVIITLLTWTVVRNLPGFPLVPTLLTH